MWFITFVRISYDYVRPRGLREHLRFIWDLPCAAYVYRDVMRAYLRDLTK